jgi:hypothetical protein
MPILQEIVDHDEVTDAHQYRYQSTPKHHGADREAAQWLRQLTLGEEFRIFNIADVNELTDPSGNLFGAERVGEDDLRDIGTRGEQVARFPVADANQAWHDYPAWPLAGGMKPSKAVFRRMEQQGIVTTRGRKRLDKGDRV